MAQKYIHAVGRRKSSVARIWMKPGKGDITINDKSIDEYLLRPTSKMIIRHPFHVTETAGQYDVKVNVYGGGLSGQAGAIRHGIARALASLEGELRTKLKRAGLLTRDARTKERKLPGQPGARKKYQFSKR
jgi:small subunit ribosomal protein S9